MNARTLLPLVAFLAAYLVACSNPASTAGNSSDTGNARVAAVSGTALGEDGRAAVNALARLRPHAYSATGQAGATAQGQASVRTDAAGRFRIDNVPYGRYVLELNDSAGHAVMSRFEAGPGAGESIRLGEQVLRSVVTVSGTVATPPGLSVPAYATVYGLERTVPVDPATGAYTFTDLPAGQHRIRIGADVDSLGVLEVETGVVTAGSAQVVEPVTLTTFAGEDYSLWDRRATIRLNTTATGADVAETVYDFPLLVRLDPATVDLSAARDDGHDIRFAKADGTHLRYEREYFDKASNTTAFWVLIDTLYGNSDTQTLVLHWGKADAADHSCPSCVFHRGNGFAGVWHLSETGFDPRRNAAQDRFHGRPGNYEGDEQSAGIVGMCDQMDWDDHDTLGDIDASDTALTLSAWVNMDSLTPFARIVSKPHSDTSATQGVYQLAFRHEDTAQVGFRIEQRGSAVRAVNTGPNRLQPDQWVLLTGTYHNGLLFMYYNGAATAERHNTRNSLLHSDAPAMLAWYRVTHQKFVGKIDEVRISRVSRSAAWVKLSYENQREDQVLIQIE